MVVPKHIGYRNFSHHPVPAKIRDPEQRFEDEENHQYRGQPFTDLVENSLAIHLANPLFSPRARQIKYSKLTGSRADTVL